MYSLSARLRAEEKYPAGSAPATVETDTDRAFARFRKLLPTDPLLTGTVAAVWEDGTATVELPGGAQIRVKGTATVGQRVFVQTGAIQGEAPALTALVVEV